MQVQGVSNEWDDTAAQGRTKVMLMKKTPPEYGESPCIHASAGTLRQQRECDAQVP